MGSRMRYSSKIRLLTPAIAALCVVLATLVIPISVAGGPAPLGHWETYRYTRRIPVGEARVHIYRHVGAINGFSILVSSTGEVDLWYSWDPPILTTIVTNLDDFKIKVRWDECFYVG